jgi:hypothetical protein
VVPSSLWVIEAYMKVTSVTVAIVVALSPAAIGIRALIASYDSR